jgi:hypothetical protein
MGIRDQVHRLADELHGVRQAIAGLNDEVDRVSGIEFPKPDTRLVAAPASFVPPSPFPVGSPTNPLPSSGQPPPGTIFDSNGNPVNRTRDSRSGGSSSKGKDSGGDGGKTLTLAENPLVYSIDGRGPVLYSSDLEAYLSIGTCQLIKLPSGGEMISCPFGMYPGLSGGVLRSMSARSSKSIGGGGSGGGSSSTRSRNGRPSYGDVDVSRPTYGDVDVSRPAGSSATGASSVSLDSRPITDRLDGLRSDVREMTRALQGDGGAGIRFKGGL